MLALPEVEEGGDHGDEEDGRDQVVGHGAYPFGDLRLASTRERTFSPFQYCFGVVSGLDRLRPAAPGAWLAAGP
jgi:hypothetical protein